MTNNDEYSEWTKQFNTTINKVAEITIETNDPSVVKKILNFIWDNDLRAMPKVKYLKQIRGDSMSHQGNDRVLEDIYEYLYEQLKREPTTKEVREEFERRAE